MESKSNKTLSKAVPHVMPLRLFPLAVALAFVLHFSGFHTFVCQELTTAASPISTKADYRFDTPQATAAYWVQAVNKHNWREEYDSYTGKQQAKFTYHVMVSTAELSDSQDLCISLQQILQRFRFPSNLLDEFPSQRMDLSDLQDPEQIQSAIDGQAEKFRLQLAKWQREVQPLQIDWAEMIGELQPLLIENYQRHLRDNHPITNGITHHLGYHRFEQASNIKIDGNHAHGMIVAVVRDRDMLGDQGTIAPEANRLKKISASLGQLIQKLTLQERPLKRDPEKVSLVRETDAWKIDSVPFR